MREDILYDAHGVKVVYFPGDSGGYITIKVGNGRADGMLCYHDAVEFAKSLKFFMPNKERE